MIHWLSIQEWTAKEKKRKGWQRGPTMPCSFNDSACSLGTKMDRTSIRCTCGHLRCRHSLPGQDFRSTPATATTLDIASSQSQYGCNVVTLLCKNTQAGNSTVIVQYINFIQLSSPQTASIGSGIQYRKIGCCTFGTSPSLKDVNIAGHVTNRVRSICAYCWEVECWACRLKAASAWCTASLQNITRYLSSAVWQYGILSLFVQKRASYVWTLGASKYVFRCDSWKENLKKFNELKSKHLDLWCIISCFKACKMGAPHHSEVAGHHARNGWTTWIKNIKNLTSFHFWSCCRD